MAQAGGTAPGTMVIVNGCGFPDGLFYDVPNHLWYLPLADGGIRLGMTVVGAALASYRIFAFTPKRVGRSLQKGRSCATIESSKWVGPARIAFDGTVRAVNDALIQRPAALVTDPYGAGWMMVAIPAGADPLAGLVTGGAIVPAYDAWMRQESFPGCPDPAP
jgi:glycine cleavage system H protein